MGFYNGVFWVNMTQSDFCILLYKINLIKYEFVCVTNTNCQQVSTEGLPPPKLLVFMQIVSNLNSLPQNANFC